MGLLNAIREDRQYALDSDGYDHSDPNATYEKAMVHLKAKEN